MPAQRDHQAVNMVFKALADPTRRSILVQLAGGELPAGDIVSRFDISGPSISRHLSVLRASGLVKERRQANRVIYSVAPSPLAECVGAFMAALGVGEALAPAKLKKKHKPATKRAKTAKTPGENSHKEPRSPKPKGKAKVPPSAKVPALGTLDRRPETPVPSPMQAAQL